MNSHSDVVDALVSAGADVNTPAHNGQSPLKAACTADQTNCIKLLAAAGADVNYQDMDGHSLVYSMALDNRPLAIRLLVNAAAGEHCLVSVYSLSPTCIF